MFSYIIKSKKTVAAYLLLIPCGAVASVLFVGALQPLIDVVYEQDWDGFRKYGLFFAVAAGMDMLFMYLCKICKERLKYYFTVSLKRDVFDSLWKKNIMQFNTMSTAQYLSVVTRDIPQIEQQYFNSICGIYRVGINALITFCVIVVLNPFLAVLNLAMGLLSVAVPRLFEKKLELVQEQASKSSERYIGLLNDYLKGFSTIKLFHIQDRIRAKMENANEELGESVYHNTKAVFTATWFSILCTQISFILTMIAGVYMTLKGYMTVGGIIAMSQLIGGITTPFEELPEYISNLKSVKVLNVKVTKLMQTAEEAVTEISDKEHGEDMLIQEGFGIEQVSFSYEEQQILSGVSCRLKADGKYIIVGDSGSGKSTLARLLMGFYPCSSGKISLGGKLLSEYPEVQRYRCLTYLEQDIFLFDDTLYNNITLYQSYTKEQVDRAVRLAGLEKMIQDLEEGIYTQIQGNGRNFSGGEKQRIAIARALISGAKFLILDEITANLDTVLAREIEDTIMNLKDTGVLLITHRLSEKLLRQSDEILVLKKGKLVEKGSFEQLLAQKGDLYSYYQLMR